MSDFSQLTIFGMLAGLGAAFFQALSYFFSKRFLTECHAGFRVLFCLSMVQMGMMSLLALPFLLPRPLPPLTEFIGPLIGVTVFFLSGQWFLFYLLKSADSSVVAPMLGLKIPILGVVSVLFLNQHLSPSAWIAILLAVTAAFMISPPRSVPESRTLSFILLICIFYSGSDLHIPVLVERLEPYARHPALLGVVLTYILCGFIGLLAGLRQRAFRVPRGQYFALPYSLSWLAGITCLFITFSLIGVIFGNMLQSIRGFIAVIVGVMVSRAGLLHIETRISARGWLLRLGGAAVMTAAIMMYYADNIDAMEASEMNFTVVAEGANSGYPDRNEYVIRDAEEWRELWSKVVRNRMPPPEPPEVDFSEQMILAVFQGEKPTGGYGISITDVKQTENIVEVLVQERTPKPTDMVITALTQPYHIVKTERTDKEVRFIREADEPDKEE